MRIRSAALYLPFAGIAFMLMGVGWLFSHIPLGSLAWFLPGLSFVIVGVIGNGRRAQIKRNGVCYDAQVVGFKATPLFTAYKMGYVRQGLRWESVYVDNSGQTHTVYSGIYQVTGDIDLESVKAVVYVNPDNPRKCVVEVLGVD